MTSASLFDVASIVYRVDPAELKHPLAFYIPKSESAEEALWWRDLFQALAEARGWPRNYIKCMALVESHPLAFQMEEFLYNLRDHIVGLEPGALGLHGQPDPFQSGRSGMGAARPQYDSFERSVFPEPARTDAGDLPQARRAGDWRHDGAVSQPGGCRVECARAGWAWQKDKKNEADCLMDGAWTGHPDQNQIALDQFPFPNQLQARRAQAERYPESAAGAEKALASTRWPGRGRRCGL